MTKNILISTLSAIGLSKEEGEVYIYLATHGASNLSSIAKGVAITRATLYVHVKKLITKECIYTTKLKKRLLYQAHDPQTLLARFEQVYKEGSQALSVLAAHLHSTTFVPEIKVYSGHNELSKIYENLAITLPKGGTYFRYTSRKDDLPRSPLYSALRKEKELERLVITSEQKSKLKGKDANRFIKTVPKEFAFDDNVTLLIYGTKVSYMDFNSGTGIVIDSPHLARFQEKIFKLLWRKL